MFYLRIQSFSGVVRVGLQIHMVSAAMDLKVEHWLGSRFARDKDVATGLRCKPWLICAGEQSAHNNVSFPRSSENETVHTGSIYFAKYKE